MNKEAYNYCIFLLSKRDYSSFKIRQKLIARKYNVDEIEDIISDLIAKRYLIEENYIKTRVKTLLLNGFSNSYIVQKLKLEKIEVSSEIIDYIKTENQIFDIETINRLVEKKLKNKKIPSDFNEKIKMKNKIIRYLIGKGHSFSIVNSLIDSHLR